ncbi:MAG TPA: hypothetical protein VM598_14685 [Bdellovibrionota bacterium]|nr:hypothetical protein [Bdellovibrionota bacterium]
MNTRPVFLVILALFALVASIPLSCSARIAFHQWRVDRVLIAPAWEIKRKTGRFPESLDQIDPDWREKLGFWINYSGYEDDCYLRYDEPATGRPCSRTCMLEKWGCTGHM